MIKFLSFLLLLSTGSAWAANKGIVEGVAASSNTIFIDTGNVRVDISTKSYGGGIPSVGLYVASNAVVSVVSNDNNTVLYSSGSITTRGKVTSTSGGFGFPDGTTQTTAASAGGTYVSSRTIIFPATTSVSPTGDVGFSGCNLGASTLTITTDGTAAVTFSFSIGMSFDVAVSSMGIIILQDGNYINNEAASTPICEYNFIASAGVSNIFTCAITQETSAIPSAGSHSYCIGGFSGAANRFICAGGSMSPSCFLGVRQH